MKQLVSILIPAFNAEKWVSECIESVLAQTWPWKEIIVVDDGSTDATLEIAKHYASPNVQVLTQDNKGACVARNHALSLAQGDYIQWLDVDDLLAPDKIAKQMKEAAPGQDSRILLSCTWGRFYNMYKHSIFDYNVLWEDLDPKEWLIRKLSDGLWMPTMSWLVSRRLTLMAGPWNESLSLDQDGEYFCRVLNSSQWIRFVPDAQCFNRITLGISSAFNLNNKKLDSLAYSIFSYVKTLRNMEDTPRTRIACLQLLNRSSIYFYPERMDIFESMRSMATELDGNLHQPKLQSKYRLLQHIFGFRIAKKAQFKVPALRDLLRSLCRGPW